MERGSRVLFIYSRTRCVGLIPPSFKTPILLSGVAFFWPVATIVLQDADHADAASLIVIPSPLASWKPQLRRTLD